jgi:RNA polymerase sigma-70 factor (ECF subfamily)
MDPDRLLVRMAQNGNKAAFGKLARRYRDTVLAITYDFLNDYESAKDVSQEVFIKAFKNIGDYGEKSRFSSWLIRIAVQSSLAVRNQKQRKYFLGGKRKPDAKVELEEATKENDRTSIWLNETDNLSENQRVALILRYIHNSSIREIADIMECTQSRVRNHLHGALQKLLKSLKKRK